MSLLKQLWDGTRALVLAAILFTFFNALLVLLVLSNVSTSENTNNFILAVLDIGGWRYLVLVILTIISTHLLYILYSRYISHLSQKHWTLENSGQDIIIGSLMASILFSIIIAFFWLSGSITFSGISISTSLLIAFSLSLQAAYSEELIMRGILYRRFLKSFNHIIALIITSFTFGILHIVNPGASVLGTVNIMLTAGIILGASYAITGRLWFPIFFHLVWNFTQGGIYGLPISGIDTGGLLNSNVEGSDWITGGAFGPEASIITTLVLLPVAILFVYILYNRPDLGLKSMRYIENEDDFIQT